MMAKIRSIQLGLALLALAACTNPVDQRGNLPEADKLAQIKPGSTDKATVTQLLGSPSTVGMFDPNTWLYISQKTRVMALREPELLDQQVVAIAFDDKGIVRDVVHRTMADGETIVPNPDATPAPGREFTLLEQLIGNFGRFSGTKKSEGGSNTPGGGGP
jgi:outer membrane protein assembly factor BamE (lipoprotein component of BamABCDE complex)